MKIQKWRGSQFRGKKSAELGMKQNASLVVETKCYRGTQEKNIEQCYFVAVSLSSKRYQADQKFRELKKFWTSVSSLWPGVSSAIAFQTFLTMICSVADSSVSHASRSLHLSAYFEVKLEACAYSGQQVIREGDCVVSGSSLLSLIKSPTESPLHSL